MNPMDETPEDHGSDRYGYVEVVGAPKNVAPTKGLVDYYLREGCQDCNVNLFFHWRPELDASWHVEIAHDEACPTYARLEHDGELGEGPC